MNLNFLNGLSYMYKISLFILCTLFALPSYSEEAANHTTENNSQGVVQGCTRKQSQAQPVNSEMQMCNQSTPDTETSCCPCYCPKKNHIEIGGSYSYIYMKPAGLAHLTGNLGGFQVSYEYQAVDQIYQGVTFAWREGSLDGSGVKRSLFDIDTQGRLGYTFGDTQGSWIVSAFTGLGYRHMGEEVSSDGNSLDFDYNTLYIPVGFIANDQIYCDWYLGLNVQWRPQVYPTLKIDPLKGARWITNCTLANFLVEFPLTYVVSSENEMALVLKPFFEYWQDGRTPAKVDGLSLGIPKNTYLFGGFSLNFRYSF